MLLSAFRIIGFVVFYIQKIFELSAKFSQQKKGIHTTSVIFSFCLLMVCAHARGADVHVEVSVINHIWKQLNAFYFRPWRLFALLSWELFESGVYHQMRFHTFVLFTKYEIYIRNQSLLTCSLV